MSRIAVLDRFSIGFSTLCLLHCLAVPVLVSVLPVFATFAFADERFHLALVVLVVPTSIVALGLGCRLHRPTYSCIWIRRYLVAGWWPQRQAVNVSVNSEKRRSRCLVPALLRWLIG